MSDIRIGGLMSGMDTQAIIDKLLEAEGRKITKEQDKQVGLQTNVAAWSSVSADMTALTDALYQLRSASTWRTMTAQVSDATKLSASATTSALSATYDIAITQLAQAHSVASDSVSAGSDAILVDVIDDLEAGQAFVIEGQTIEISDTDTLLTLAGKINTAAESMDAGRQVLATIIDHRLVITREDTGADDMVLSNDTGTPLEHLGLIDSGTWKNQLRAGQDASFTVNGATVTRSANTNLTDVITGVTLNLLGATSSDTTLTVGRDTETPKSAIVDFMAAYNAVAEKVENYTAVDLSDPKNPRTGPLQGDLLAQTILRSMRSLATEAKSALTAENAAYTYGDQSGVANSLESIGIWTSGRENRLAIVDEAKLDHMLANYFDETEQVFRGVYDEEAGANTGGVALDLHAYANGVSAPLTGEIARRVNTVQDRIDDTDTTIERMYMRLDEYERTLWAQFGAMEQAIAAMQQELSWLTSQLGGNQA